MKGQGGVVSNHSARPMTGSAMRPDQAILVLVIYCATVLGLLVMGGLLASALSTR